MDPQFSDDRDVLPEGTSPPDNPRRRRYATALGRISIALLILLIIIASSLGGTISDWNDPAKLWSLSYRQDFLLCRGLEILLGFWLFTVGSSVASFLNVVAWRAPRGMSINGHSFCPRCETPIKSIDNVPVIGWLRLRGKCLVCKLPISPKYPVYELIGGLLFLLLYATEFLSHGRNIPMHHPNGLAYGIPVNISQLPTWVHWSFAIHLVLIAFFLLLNMTRSEGTYQPWYILAAPVVAIIVLIFVVPSGRLWTIESQAIQGGTAWIEVLRFIAVAIAAGFILAVATVRTNWQDGAIDRRRVTSWTVACIAGMLASGATICTLIFATAILIATAFRWSKSKWQHGSLADAMTWLVLTTPIFLISWKWVVTSYLPATIVGAIAIIATKIDR